MFALELETRLYYLSITITTDPSSAQMGFEFDNFSNFQSLISNIERVIMTRCVRKMITHPALRRRGDVAATSLCTSQQRRRYVSNETPNDVSMERHQDISGCVSTTSYWNVITTSQKDVTTTPHHYVSTTSQTSLK